MDKNYPTKLEISELWAAIESGRPKNLVILLNVLILTASLVFAGYSFFKVIQNGDHLIYLILIPLIPIAAINIIAEVGALLNFLHVRSVLNRLKPSTNVVVFLLECETLLSIGSGSMKALENYISSSE